MPLSPPIIHSSSVSCCRSPVPAPLPWDCQPCLVSLPLGPALALWNSLLWRIAAPLPCVPLSLGESPSPVLFPAVCHQPGHLAACHSPSQTPANPQLPPSLCLCTHARCDPRWHTQSGVFAGGSIPDSSLGSSLLGLPLPWPQAPWLSLGSWLFQGDGSLLLLTCEAPEGKEGVLSKELGLWGALDQ